MRERAEGEIEKEAWRVMVTEREREMILKRVSWKNQIMTEIAEKKREQEAESKVDWDKWRVTEIEREE